MSLFTYAFNGSSENIGIFALFFGGISIFFVSFIAFGAWSANIFFFINFLIGNSKLRTKLIISGIALLLGILALFVTDLPVHMGSSTSPVRIGLGFYFWYG